MLLAIDTATTTASIAVYDLDKRLLLAEESWLAGRRQTQDILVVAQSMLSLLNLSPQSLTALAVATGPGSFTGVRIGISAAKGITLGLPQSPRVVGIPTLCVTAAPWLTPANLGESPAQLCACIQAGRGRFNWAFFSPSNPLWQPNAADYHVGTVPAFVEVLTARAPQPIWLVGETTKALVDKLAGQPHIALIDPVSGLRRAGQLARLAAAHLDQDSYDDSNNLRPLYLRSPE